MASADHGRSRRDEDRYRDSRRRDDKFSDRRHDDRRDRDRDRERDRERDRDRDRNRRRSRSPDFRRDRRERSRDRDRYRNDRGPRRDYDGRDNRRDGRDARDSRGDSRDNRGGDRAYDRHRGSKSATPARALESRSDDRLSRDEKPKDKSMEEKLARLAEWKKKQAEKKAQQVAETDGTAQSPTTTAPTTTAPTTTASTTTASVTPTVTSEPAKAQPQVNGNAEVAKQKNTVKLDETAKVKPLQSKPVGVTVPAVSQQAKAPSLSTNDAIALKFKPKATQELQEEKSALLDDEGETSKKRKLQALPASVPEYTPLDDVEEDAAMSDIASDEEQKQLEKRRADIAIEYTHMEDAPAAPEDKMEVEDEDVDPLDAFMADLTEKPARGAPQGQAMFGEDLEPDMNAIKDDDLFALAAARKKKKEVPVIDHSKVAYEPFRKHFYTAPQEISDMTDEEVADLRLQLDGIKVKPATVPRPVLNFAQMGLMTATLDVLRGVGYETPTPIQSQAVSIILSGIDVLAVARTGSGKTLAFILPTIRHILDQPPLKPTDGPICLVVAPTRELALQIVNEAKPFLKASNLKIACAYGGPPISEHIALMKRGGIRKPSPQHLI
jgi:ATP-dependent RNA helicase DDX46/PRP5